MELRTAYDIAYGRTSRFFPIPPITDPMGKNWKQPSRTAIEIDDKNALMTKETLEELADYSCTSPSGVYPGKMWRRRVDYHDESKGWVLVWYGAHENPAMCSIHSRRILLA